MSEPYIQFYPADYLADTMHLTLEEHGAYLKLLFCMWRAGGTLPDDDKKLCIILGVGAKKWRALKPSLKPFFTYENGVFSQDRLSRERKSAEAKRKGCSSSGSLGARARWLKDNDSPLANAMPDAKQSPKRTDGIARGPSDSEAEPEKIIDAAVDDVRDVVVLATELVNWISSRFDNRQLYISAPVIAWLKAGADPEADIKPVIERHLASGREPPRSSLAFFDRDIAESIRQRTKQLNLEDTHAGRRNSGRTAMPHAGFSDVDYRASAKDSGFLVV